MRKYIRHGDYKTRLYRMWSSMKSRCHSKFPSTRRVYLDRKIKYCNDWDYYINFKAWALENGYQGHLSLDRIDNCKGYEPNNCRFVTIHEQRTHRRPFIYWMHGWKEYAIKNNYVLPLIS